MQNKADGRFEISDHSCIKSVKQTHATVKEKNVGEWIEPTIYRTIVNWRKIYQMTVNRIDC